VAVDDKRPDFAALCAELKPVDVKSFLASYRWHQVEEESGGRDNWTLVLEFLRGVQGDPGIERWLLLAPKMARGAEIPWQCGTAEFAVRERSRTPDGGRYLVYSEPLHIIAAKYLACVVDGRALNQETADLRRKKQAVLLFYPVLTSGESRRRMTPTMGFVLWLPQNSIRRRIAYSVIDQSQKEAVVIDASPDKRTPPS